MKKRVNGRIVDINNIDIFEKATEGMAINRTTQSVISDYSDIDFSSIEKCIKLYNNFYKSLPFPLYALDTNLKYATIGSFIKMKLSEEKESTPFKYWVNAGLNICINEEYGTTLTFVNNTWGINKVDSIKEDNTEIELYKEHCGYTEFKWALDKISSGKSTSAYYKEFMPEFIQACNGQPMVLKWELSNILEFGPVPNRYNFQDNKIIDLESKNEYLLDIFVTGVRESKEKQHIWSLCDDDIEPIMRPKYVKTFGFEVLEKISTAEDEKIKANVDKLKKCELYGATSIFNTLCSIRNIEEQNCFDSYKAFICEGNLVYIINNRVFVAKAYKFVEPKEVARGVELYAYDRGLVYFVKNNTLAKGIKKETIYSYSLRDGNLRLCRIRIIN